MRGGHAQNCAEKSGSDEYMYFLFTTNTNMKSQAILNLCQARQQYLTAEQHWKAH